MSELTSNDVEEEVYSSLNDDPPSMKSKRQRFVPSIGNINRAIWVLKRLSRPSCFGQWWNICRFAKVSYFWVRFFLVFMEKKVQNYLFYTNWYKSLPKGPLNQCLAPFLCPPKPYIRGASSIIKNLVVIVLVRNLFVISKGASSSIPAIWGNHF